MRLLQLDPNGTEDGVLDLHPMITVVRGLRPEGRALLQRAVLALPRGDEPGCRGLLESHGIFLDLDAATLSMLGMGTDVDVVVDSTEVAKVVDRPVAAPVAALHLAADDELTVERFLEITPEGRFPALDAARHNQNDAREALAIFRQAADVVRVEVEAVAATRRRAEAALAAARSSESHPHLRLVEGGASDDEVAGERQRLEAEVAELEAVIQRASSGISELRALDVRPIQVLVEALRNPEPVELVSSERGAELADEFETLRRGVDELEATVQVGGVTFAGAMSRLEAARAELAEAERSMSKPELSPADVAELEAAHEEVLDAERKASGGLGKRAAAKRLEEARDAEQAILDRVGYPTWSSYVMGASLFTIDPLAQERLNQAKFDLEAAEASWAEISAEMQAHPEHRDLLERLEAVYLEAIDLLGGDHEEDIASALRQLKVAKREVTAEELVDALAYQLELVGFPLGSSPTEDRTLLIADAFLEEASGVQDRIAELEGERAEAEQAQALAERQLAQLDEPVIDLTADDAPDAEVDLAPLEEALAAAVEDERDTVELLEAREALLDAAIQAESVATGKLKKVAADLLRDEAERHAADPLAAFEGLEQLAAEVAPAGEEGSAREALEVYLMARLAALRAVSFAGSVPLLVDDALQGLDRDDLTHVLDKLDRMADAVQVIYATDDDHVVSWAEERGFERVAVVDAPATF